MRKLLKKYNSSVEILRQNGYTEFVDLTWETASDISNTIYYVNIPSEDGIPLSVKRTAVDAMNLIERLTEEEDHLTNEMENCLQTFYGSCRDLEETINCMSDSVISDSAVVRGACSLKRNDLHEDINLRVACNLFRECIAIEDDFAHYAEQHCQTSIDVLDIDNADDTDDDEDDVDNQSDSVYTE